MTRIERLDARRARRRPLIITVMGLAIIGLLALLVGTASDANGSAEYGDYNHSPHWPTDVTVCVKDNSHGFPVAEALREFDDIGPRFELSEDCSDAIYRVQVVTINDPDLSWTGHYDGAEDADGNRLEGKIRINLARAWKMTPHLWRLMLVHEFAHSAGLGHTYEVDSIMAPDARIAHLDGLTDADRDQLEAIYP